MDIIHQAYTQMQLIYADYAMVYKTTTTRQHKQNRKPKKNVRAKIYKQSYKHTFTKITAKATINKKYKNKHTHTKVQQQ